MSNRPLHILHVITDLEDGGAEGTLYRLCKYDTQNHHTVISLMDKGKFGPLLEEMGVSVYCLGMPRGKVNFLRLVRFWRLVRSIQPDLVQTWLYHADLLGGLIAWLAGMSNICWGIRHSNLSSGTVKRSTIYVAHLCALLSHWLPRRIISCSKEAASSHIKLGYAKKKFIVIPNGYDVIQYTPDTSVRNLLREGWGIGKNDFLIGMVARFDIQKDHQNLLKALSLLKQSGLKFHCILAGTNMDLNNKLLQKWLHAEDLMHEVICLGRRDDIPQIMNSLDLHVLSSLGEAFPNVLAEAMASGTPCVSTDVGDAALIVGNSGWIVPPANSAALAEAIGQAKHCRDSDVPFWDRRRLLSRKLVTDQFGIDAMTARYSLLWREVVCEAEF